MIAGGGVAALEAALALGQLAPEQTDVTVIAPNFEFVYRPMTVTEPSPLAGRATMSWGRSSPTPVRGCSSMSSRGSSPRRTHCTQRAGAIFGQTASNAVSELLAQANVKMITSAYAEVPESGEVEINPGDRRLRVDRVVALPELSGPGVRGIPLGENGFIRVDPYGHVRDISGPIYAAGDAIDFPIKHGGLGSQQADSAAESVAALAGAPVTPKPFHPLMHAKLLTYDEPLYLTAQITGGHGFSSEVSDTPTWSPPSKIATRYLAPYLDTFDRGTDQARSAGGPDTGARDDRPMRTAGERT